ncbi:MAG: histidine phosphatase family protein [Anaerolineae bacterium]
MTTLFLIRHGQTAWNLEGKYTGQSDIPLNETGRIQAARLVYEISQKSIDSIFASDLDRAIETAKIALRECTDRFGVVIPIQTDARLREINQGVWEGMHFDEIKRRFGTEFAAREADPLKVSAPGGETVGEVQDRVLSAVHDICQDNVNGRVAIVGHGLALAIIRGWLLESPIKDVWSLIPPNAEIIEVDVPAESLAKQVR